MKHFEEGDRVVTIKESEWYGIGAKGVVQSSHANSSLSNVIFDEGPYKYSERGEQECCALNTHVEHDVIPSDSRNRRLLSKFAKYL